ncbi:response regulator transcription factor [Streptomyces sp. FXJ1.4098]|nr:response regulator transcription factor [Streptomyces sp. FXJ1.4098]
MNILIVEDDDRIAEALKQTLRVHGYESNYVGTGAAALTRLADAGLVLLDLGLPDLDGHEVCRRIRELSCVPVIVLSGRTEELDRVMALHMGADDFVAKPFSRYELVARIQAVLRRAGGCPQHAADPAAPAPVSLETSLPEPELHGPEQPPLQPPLQPHCRSARSGWTRAPANCSWTARKCTSPARSSTCWRCCSKSPER